MFSIASTLIAMEPAVGRGGRLGPTLGSAKRATLPRRAGVHAIEEASPADCAAQLDVVEKLEVEEEAMSWLMFCKSLATSFSASVILIVSSRECLRDTGRHTMRLHVVVVGGAGEVVTATVAVPIEALTGTRCRCCRPRRCLGCKQVAEEEGEGDQGSPDPQCQGSRCKRLRLESSGLSP